MRTLALIVVGAMGFAGAHASAEIAWDESVDGDLSTDPNAPTPLVFGLGSHAISGTMAGPNDIRDFITFTIGPGEVLASLLLQAYVDVGSGGPGNRGFHAINAGPTSFIPSGATAPLFLGGDHLDPMPAGTDLLPLLAAAPLAGSGFTVPLGPGTYSYLVQQTGTPLTQYTIQFDVIPAPSSVALLMSAGAIGAMFRRRR